MCAKQRNQMFCVMTAKQALQFFGLRDSPSVVVPEGGLLLPLIDGALTTSERGHGAPSGGGFLFPAFIQENRPLIQRFLFCYKLSSFNAARSPPMCTIAHSYGTLGRSCTQVRSSFCRGSVFARDKTGGGRCTLQRYTALPVCCMFTCLGACFSFHLLQ